MRTPYTSAHLKAIQATGKEAMNATSEVILQLIVSGLREGIWNDDPVTREKMIGLAASMKKAQPSTEVQLQRKAV